MLPTVSFNVFAAGFCRLTEELKARIQLNALYHYVARSQSLRCPQKFVTLASLRTHNGPRYTQVDFETGEICYSHLYTILQQLINRLVNQSASQSVSQLNQQVS